MTARRFAHACIGIALGLLLIAWTATALALVAISALARFHLP